MTKIIVSGKTKQDKMETTKRICEKAGLSGDPRTLKNVERFRKEDLRAFEVLFNRMDRIDKSTQICKELIRMGIENFTDAELICIYPLTQNVWGRIELPYRECIEKEALGRGIQLKETFPHGAIGAMSMCRTGKRWFGGWFHPKLTITG